MSRTGYSSEFGRSERFCQGRFARRYARTAQRAGAKQIAVTYVSQTVSDPPTRAEIQALNDGLVATVTLLNEMRAAW